MGRVVHHKMPFTVKEMLRRLLPVTPMETIQMMVISTGMVFAPSEGQGRDRHVPVIPALLIHGREAMENMIKGWWRTWRACRPSSKGALLQDVEQGNNSIVPTYWDIARRLGRRKGWFQ